MQPLSEKRIISVNVGKPREVDWKGRKVESGIFKEPVPGKIAVGKLNLAGDQQADLTVHGGVHKAIYVYPAEYYDFWRAEFPTMTLNWGMFGENLTITGLLDTTVHIGDRFRMGTAEVIVTQPRLPCNKLRVKFGRDDILKRFLNSRYTGFYLAVEKQGEVQAGDPITELSQNQQQVTVTDFVNLYTAKHKDPALIAKISQIESVPEDWQEYFQEYLETA